LPLCLYSAYGINALAHVFSPGHQQIAAGRATDRGVACQVHVAPESVIDRLITYQPADAPLIVIEADPSDSFTHKPCHEQLGFAVVMGRVGSYVFRC